MVAAGDRLTHSTGQSEPAVISPVAGRIIGIAQATLFNGAAVDAVEIETLAISGDTAISGSPDVASEHHMLRSTDFGHWIDRLLGAGISASRVSCPDLADQLHQCLSRPIDTVMCCVLDCDPNLPLNNEVAREHPRELAAGIDLLAKLTGAMRVWVAADTASSTGWFSALDPLIRADGLRLVPLRPDYPQSHPTLLLHTLLGRRLRPGRLPVEQGVLLLDSAAAVAIGGYVLGLRSMLEIPIAVRDHVRRKTHLLRVPIGTCLSDICRAIGVPSQEVLFRGGDFLRDEMLPASAVAGGGELTIHITPRETLQNPDPCVRCGWCIEACPTLIQPAGLLEASQRNDLAMGEKFGLHACIECGICTYVCPSRLPLLSSIRRLNGVIGPPESPFASEME